MSMKIKAFNDSFAIFVVAIISGITVLHGLAWIVIPEMVLGAMWATGFTLIVQYYFRKAPPVEASK